MAGTCGGPMMGGKRRKTARKMKGGMGYGFGGTIGTAGPQWDSSWGGEVTKAGVPVYDSADPQRGGAEKLYVKPKGMSILSARAVGALEPIKSKKGVDTDRFDIVTQSEVKKAESEKGGRRRKSKRKTKGKGKKKTMRGGAQWQSVAGVGYGYTGSGSRGLADPTAYASKVPPAGGPSQNADGAYHV